MTCFIDTSAIYALLDAADSNHARATAAWRRLLGEEATGVVTNYILVETFALVQHRLGIEAVRSVQEDLVPLLTTAWIDEATHREALAALFAAGRRALSLVDCASFSTMRRLGLRDAFAFDAHFAEQGFRLFPHPRDT